MENKTLQLKDICGYLPYGLKVQLSHKGIVNLDLEYPDERANGKFEIYEMNLQTNEIEICRDDIDYTIGYIEVDEVSPILYPIDYLYKPITHNGKEIIPIVELANLAEKGEWELHIKCTLNNHEDVFFYADGDFVFYIEGNDHRRTNQLPLFDLCHELKIDIRGLIPQGLAVSVDEFEVNPYK